nr:hypothetical protein [uncultured Kingella sp.]
MRNWQNKMLLGEIARFCIAQRGKKHLGSLKRGVCFNFAETRFARFQAA